MVAYFILHCTIFFADIKNKYSKKACKPAFSGFFGKDLCLFRGLNYLTNINETLGKSSDLGDFLGVYKESYATDSRKKDFNTAESPILWDFSVL